MPTEKGSNANGSGIPRFTMPMILMQSVLVPEYSNKPDQVKPVLPTLTRRVCNSKPSSSINQKDTNACRLPFQDGEALSGYSQSIGRRSNSRQASSSNFEKERADAARKKLNQDLHAEHRVFMEQLKLERENDFQIRTIAAVDIQRYMRGLAVRIRKNPQKYATLRASLETHYTKEELSKLVTDAIRRAGVADVA